MAELRPADPIADEILECEVALEDATPLRQKVRRCVTLTASVYCDSRNVNGCIIVMALQGSGASVSYFIETDRALAGSKARLVRIGQ